MAEYPICSIQNCDNPVRSKNLCSGHYQRLRIYGDARPDLPLTNRRKRMPQTCTVDGCGFPTKAKGYCNMHWLRCSHFGDPISHGKPWRRDEPREFYRDVVVPYDGDDCLIWPFTRLIDGRGQMGRKLVHRVLCEAVHGPPPTPVHEAAHSCGNGRGGCVTKRHLSWKTPAENMMDKRSHGQIARGERGGSAKLTEADVLDIRRSQREFTAAELSKRFSVGESTIRMIWRRETWAHI